MGLFGSLFTGVSALAAQSQNTAIISNNIANVNTTGFKKSEAAFYSLVTTESNSSRYSPGTVSVNRIQRVNQQGPISQSSSATDASVSGNGFFAVKRDSLDSALTEYLYTRNGQFSEDAAGFLRNSAGFYLYGWPIDVNGDLPANQGDLNSLVPIDVAFLGGLTRPTSSAEISVNLNSAESDTVFGAAPTSPADFTRGVTVYDTLGNPQTLNFEFTKTYGPQAAAPTTRTLFTATDRMVNDLGITNGNRFTINVDGGPARTYQISDLAGAPPPVGVDVMVYSIGDLIDDVNTNVPNLNAYLGADGEIVFQHADFVTGAETFTITDTVGTALSSLGFTPGVFTSDDIGTAGYYENGTFAV